MTPILRRKNDPETLDADTLYTLALDFGAEHKTAAKLLEAVLTAEEEEEDDKSI